MASRGRNKKVVSEARKKYDAEIKAQEDRIAEGNRALLEEARKKRAAQKEKRDMLLKDVHNDGLSFLDEAPTSGAMDAITKEALSALGEDEADDREIDKTEEKAEDTVKNESVDAAKEEVVTKEEPVSDISSNNNEEKAPILDKPSVSPQEPIKVSDEQFVEETAKAASKKTREAKSSTKGEKYVKSAKRRAEKTVSSVKTIRKASGEERNYTFTQSFSVDEDTWAHLEAAVELLQKSGLTIDDRLVTASGLCRRALQNELKRLYEANGQNFKDQIEEIIARKNNSYNFTLG